MFGNYDKYIAVFLTALVVTYLLTPLVRSLAHRFGIMDLPDERRPAQASHGPGWRPGGGVGSLCRLSPGAGFSGEHTNRRLRLALVAEFSSGFTDPAGHRIGG